MLNILLGVVGVTSVFSTVVLLACCKVSSQCSREEEAAELRRFHQDENNHAA